ncbi:hypothetical protein BJ138DRAFT_1010403 [Hygrophoropsis aurantiaca]|uniref:Uncharacterized protein n=1 Tax=Hygrophoropsis aurantiaca TaxID=72124 RepID=A0ACB8A982_9AGAM|nr:hypothetical protein BJ138DRAFT_1010403 [Hygrophoropsis aurantiaca]
MRNRFISEYVFRVTGKYRSAKQVGSRLQQLRDTSEGRELIESLTRRYLAQTEPGSSSARFNGTPQHASWHTYSSPTLSSISSDFPSSDSSSSCSSLDSPISSANYSPLMAPIKAKAPGLNTARTVVHIDILPAGMAWSNLPVSPKRSPHAVATSPPHSRLPGTSHSQPSSSPRPIHSIDPTVTFVSPSAMIAKSSYIVLLDGAPIHSEDTKMQCVGPCQNPSTATNAAPSSLLYSTSLVPKFWDTICNSSDPTVYTIMQDVYRIPEPSSYSESSSRPRPLLIFSTIYHFRYPSSASSTSPPTIRSPHIPKMESPAMTPADVQSLLGFCDQNALHDIGLGNIQKYGHHSAYKGAADVPFLMDVGLDDLNLDDFTIDLQNFPENTSPGALAQSTSACFPTDLSNYVSFLFLQP